MQAYSKYDAYRQSGVPWIGDIPDGWDLKPGFTALKENNLKNKGMIEEQVLSLSYGNVVIKPQEKLTGLVPESFETYQIVEPGYIIFRPTDLQNDVTSLRTGLAKNKGIITSAYIALKPSEATDARYIHYLLHAYDLMKVFYGLGSGLRQNISFDDFKRLPIVLPAKETQTRIANFLDQKTKEIDEAIAKKQQLIELLKEQKAILINQAVTKGLNPDVPMKDSGVEWIGEIPEHWEIKRLKYLLDEINIRSKTGEEELLSLSKYKGVTPKSSLEERAGMAESLVGYKCVKPEQLVINKMQAVNGLLSVSKISGITSPDYSVYVSKNDKLDINFLSHLLLQNIYLAEFKRRVTGVMEGFIRLYTDDLYDIPVFYPSAEEQQQIIRYIQSLSDSIENVQSAIGDEIALLDEYKKTLISQIVTGKIKI